MPRRTSRKSSSAKRVYMRRARRNSKLTKASKSLSRLIKSHFGKRHSRFGNHGSAMTLGQMMGPYGAGMNEAESRFGMSAHGANNATPHTLGQFGRRRRSSKKSKFGNHGSAMTLGQMMGPFGAGMSEAEARFGRRRRSSKKSKFGNHGSAMTLGQMMGPYGTGMNEAESRFGNQDDVSSLGETTMEILFGKSRKNKFGSSDIDNAFGRRRRSSSKKRRASSGRKRSSFGRKRKSSHKKRRSHKLLFGRKRRASSGRKRRSSRKHKFGAGLIDLAASFGRRRRSSSHKRRASHKRRTSKRSSFGRKRRSSRKKRASFGRKRRSSHKKRRSRRGSRKH